MSVSGSEYDRAIELFRSLIPRMALDWSVTAVHVDHVWPAGTNGGQFPYRRGSVGLLAPFAQAPNIAAFLVGEAIRVGAHVSAYVHDDCVSFELAISSNLPIDPIDTHTQQTEALIAARKAVEDTIG